jgi:hypothetical protein
LFLYSSLFLAVNSPGGSAIKSRHVAPQKYEVLSTFEAAFQVIDRSKGRLMLTGGEAAAVEHEKAEGAAVDNDDRAERP